MLPFTGRTAHPMALPANPMPDTHSAIEADEKPHADAFAAALLAWYDRHARKLPWRIPPKQSKSGVRPDPYRVWLSEIMLQQTQVATVRDYYEKFLDNWPSVEALAAAETEDVMKAWAGLGYYSRARNLNKCADEVASQHGSRFPKTADELRQLPGIGDYTAAAIAAIAFGEPVAVVDGNVERIIARQYRIETPLPAAKAEIRQLLTPLVPNERPGDFAQAMMDLGATLCSPKKPACSLCPVSEGCQAFKAGDAERFPRKAAKAEKPVRQGAVFVIRNGKDAVWLVKRPDSGLLGGMSALPGTDWSARKDGLTGEPALPFEGDWRKVGGVRHTFTHFHLQLEVWETDMTGAPPFKGWWSAPETLQTEALPTVMKKAIAAALPEAFRK